MFGKNPILKQDLNDGETLRIVKGSPFVTIQGEGPYVGHKASFLRLHGCNQKCWFCDTQFSDPDDPIVSKTTLIEQLTANGMPNLIVFTGGEPFIQNIRPLCAALCHQLYRVQIETAGTLWIKNLEYLRIDIVCSPKTPKIHPMILENAVAFKYVIGADMEYDGYIPIAATQPGARPAKLASPRSGAKVYLSPLDSYDAEKNKANKQKVAELAMKYDVIAGVQLHKELYIDEPV